MTSPPSVLAVTHRRLHLHPNDETLLHPAPTAVSWFPTGNLLVASHASSLTFLTPPALAPLGEISPSSPSSARILALSISPASRFLAVGRSDGVVSVLDLTSKGPVTTFTLSAPIVSISFQRSADSRYLACATATAVSLFSRVSNRLVARFVIASSPRNASFSGGRLSRGSHRSSSGAKITNVAFSPSHLNLLVATDESGCVNVWDIAKNVAPRPRTEPKLNGVQEYESTYSRFTSPFRAPAAALSFAPRGAEVSLCVGGFDKQLRFFDPLLKRVLFSISCPAPVSAVSFATDGQKLAVGLTNGKMQILDLDPLNGAAELLSEVVVDGDESEQPTAVRAVHFQPRNAVDEKVDRVIRASLRDLFKPTERHFPLSGIAKRASPMKMRNSTSGSGHASDDSDLLLGGFADESEDFADSLDGNTAVTTNSATTPARALRSASGPRDSDIFSPVARTPRVTKTGSHAMTKSTSFHETPDTVGRKAHITFRTPRSRTAQPFIPLGSNIEAELQSDAARLDGANMKSDNQSDYRDVGAEEVDSDSLDSLSGKLPPKAGSFGSRGYVSQLQSSTFSDDIGNAFSDEREDSRSREYDRVEASSSFTRHQKDPSTFHSTRTQDPAAGFPRSSSHNHEVRGVSKASLPRFSSLPEKMTRPASNVTFQSPRAKGVESSSGVNSTANTPRQQRQAMESTVTNSTGNPHETHVPDILTASEERQSLADNVPNWLTAFRDEIRQMMSQELNAVKSELRGDILNIHSEIIVTAARQSQEMNTALQERDRRVKQLEKEVCGLQEDNERLRRQYGLP